MSKDSAVRLNEAVGFLQEIAPSPAVGEQLVALVLAWLGTLSSAQQDALSTSISLGWYMYASAADKLVRQHRRALLLVRAFMNQEVTNYKTLVTAMNDATIRRELATLVAGLAPPPDQNARVSLADSFHYAADAERQQALAGAAEYLPLVQSCLRHISVASRVAAEKTRYERWFGRFDAARYARVLMNFQQLAAWAHPLRLYYRGTGLGRNAMEAVPPFTQAADRVAVYSVNDYGYYAADAARDASQPRRAHIFLARYYFGGGRLAVAVRTSEPETISRSGIFLHEMTHAVCRTDDVTAGGGPIYFKKKCLEQAAANNPNVIRNADSYRCYSAECENG